MVRTLSFIFEVMDKEPTLVEVWLISLFLSAVGYFLCSRNYKFIFIIFPLTVVYAAALVLELNDPQVGSTILQEAGKGYVIQNYLAIAIAVGLPILSAVFKYRQKRVSANI